MSQGSKLSLREWFAQKNEGKTPRGRRGEYTITGLAKYLGKTYVQVNRYMTGKSRMSPEIRNKIRAYTNGEVSVERIVDEQKTD